MPYRQDRGVGRLTAVVWRNVPIPETIVTPLLAGIALSIAILRTLVQPYWVFTLLGAIVLTGGLFLTIWSVGAVEHIDVSAPDVLVENGPYAFSRNPMYVGWALIYLAALLFSRSLWILLLFPVVLLVTHVWAVLPEERALEARFGPLYDAYRERVPRYL